MQEAISITEETFLSVNQRIEILIGAGEKAEQYPSRIEALERDCFVVAAPLWKGVPVRLPIGTSVEIAMITPHALYEFDTMVVGCIDRPLPMLALKYPNAVNRVQRRQFVRMAEALSVHVGAPMNQQAVTVNVSGGGVLLNMRSAEEDALRAGGEWDLELYLPEHPEPLSAVGRVLRTQRAPGAVRWQVALKFVQIEEEARRAVMQHIFRRQLQQRARGEEEGAAEA